MIVLDASVWVRALVDAGPLGDASRTLLTEDLEWVAPAHAPLEVLRTIRRYEISKLVTSQQADAFAQAVRDAEVRYGGPDSWLLEEAWAARHNISLYDAPYVALAQHYGIALVTLDERLARAAVNSKIDVVIPHA